MKRFLRDVKTFGEILGQLNKILTGKQKKQAVGVCLLIILGAAFEALGIAAILPFISAIMNPSALWKKEYVQMLGKVFAITTDTGLIIFLGIVISIVYVLKNLLLIFIAYVEARFRAGIVYELSKRMLDSYMRRPYVFFLNTNSAEMLRGINEDINGVNEIISAIFKICSVCVVTAGIGMFLVCQNPFMAFGILILAVVVFVAIVLVIKKRIKTLGLLKIELATEAYKYAHQAINGIKEISVMKREEYFLKSYTSVTHKKKNADITYNSISACPERIIEAAFICGILGLICIQVGSGEVTTSYISSLSAFAVGAMRILPSLSTLTSRMTQLVYLRPALQGVCSNIEEARKYQKDLQDYSVDHQLEKKVRSKKEISVKNICWRYPNSENYILENANMDIRMGESVALVGKSGAGKTTLADILLGLLKPEKGNVLIDDIDIFSIPYVWCKVVGYVPQSVYLLDDTIRNNVTFGIEQDKVSDEMVWSALEKAQLKHFVEALPQGLETLVGERGVKFSGGQRQRIAIARALYNDPEVLVFDEATAALDNETEQAVMESINALKGVKTLIIIAHRLKTIKLCDRFWEVENGKIVEKRYEEIVKDD